MTESASIILLVENDAHARDMLRRGLEAEGFAIVEADTEQAIFAGLERHQIALIMLELEVGDTGLDLVREIRARLNVPIFIITNRRTPIDRVAILENGADDFVTKPFHIKEVVLRIRALLHRYGADVENPIVPRDVYEFDERILDPRKRELRRKDDNSLIELTETEFKILELLLRHPSRVLSRDEIARALHGHEWSPHDRTIDGHIARLRRKIETTDDERLIKSVRGVGYVFCG